MTNKESSQFISTEDLNLLKGNKSKVVIAGLGAQKAILESQLADAEYQNRVLSLCLKYNLNDQCSIDEQTGEILKSEQKKETNI